MEGGKGRRDGRWEEMGGERWKTLPSMVHEDVCTLLEHKNTPIVSLIDTITIGLRTTEESCPSDSSQL